MSDSFDTIITRGRPVDPQARHERSERILAGARQCFVASGFHGASIAQIAAAASVSVANIYQYFENKDAIILALIQQDLEQELQLTAAIAETRFEPVKLRMVLDRFFQSEAGLESARMRKEVLSEATRNPAVAAVVRQAEDESLHCIAQSLGAAQRDGQLCDAIDTQESAHILGYLFEGLLTRFAVDPSSGARLTDLFVRTLLHILRPVARP